MAKYIMRRLLILIPILAGVLFLVFTITSFSPSTPGRLLLGVSATQEAVDLLNEQLGYEESFLPRFFHYFVGIFQGDLGISYRTRQPVLPDILVRIGPTLKLGLISMFFSTLLGISFGIAAAVKQYTALDTFSTSLAVLLSSVPTSWLGMLMMLLFALKLGWLPSNGIETWKHFVMPVAISSLTSSAGLLRLTRTMMLETIKQDYIRTARAKGCGETRVLWKHALRNACLPVVTNLGMRFAGVLSGTVVLEAVFGIPGMGSYIMQSIHAKDIPAVVSSNFILSTIFCIMVLVTDICYALLDPRTRHRFSVQEVG
jgi:peptide/nickel transport system permease protein